MAERNVLLKNVKHPFLVGLQYSFQTTDKLYFVLDFINGGEVSCSHFLNNALTEVWHKMNWEWKQCRKYEFNCLDKINLSSTLGR